MDNPYSAPNNPQYQQPQYQPPQYQPPQYQPPQPPVQTELIRELAPEGKPFDTWRFYRGLNRWSWIILGVSGGISLLTLLLVAGGVIG